MKKEKKVFARGDGKQSASSFSDKLKAIVGIQGSKKLSQKIAAKASAAKKKSLAKKRKKMDKKRRKNFFKI